MMWNLLNAAAAALNFAVFAWSHSVINLGCGIFSTLVFIWLLTIDNY